MPESQPAACILLATCNGARYLRDQIDSIVGQTQQNWRVLVSDDDSDDATPRILAELSWSDSRITVLPPHQNGRLGVTGNFDRLMRAGLETPAQVFFFCDQDDIWQPDKLQTLLGRFPEKGREAVPVLVCSDLEVVDDALRTKKRSFMKYMSLNPRPADPLCYLLTRNFVTGCAVAVNRRALTMGTPMPGGAIIHDWWLAQIAAACGQVYYEERPLVRYRQHSGNAIGARGVWHGLRLYEQGGFWRAGNRNLRATFGQAAALAEVLAGDPGAVAVEPLLRAYMELPVLGRIARLRRALVLGLRKGDGIYRIVFLLRLLSL